MTTWVEIEDRRLRVEHTPDGLVSVDGVDYTVDWAELQPGLFSLLWTDAAGRTRSLRCLADGENAILLDGARIDFALHDPRSLRSTDSAQAASGPRPLKAPMPGRIVRVLVTPGQQVEAGQGCIVIEAMKMQNELKAPRAGVVARLQAVAGETVAAGLVLLVIE